MLSNILMHNESVVFSPYRDFGDEPEFPAAPVALLYLIVLFGSSLACGRQKYFRCSASLKIAVTTDPYQTKIISWPLSTI
jgi:hypothetical protein